MQTLLSPASAARCLGHARCAFTVDVEDWYQSTVDYDAPISERVVRNTERVLEVLEECNVKGTFFVQGLVAQKYPRLLQRLLKEGHEVQSHGFSHRPLFAMDPKALRVEVENARRSLEDACGIQATAFRAPDFSILRKNLWALDILAEFGFTVDSSIFPMRLRRYGISGQPTVPHNVLLAQGRSILEAPVAIWRAGSMKIPVAGGGYFRLLPLAILDRAFREMLAANQPAIVYCHPYEFSPRELDEYRGQIASRLLFTQSLGRASFVERVRHLLKTFPFGRMDEVLANWNANRS